MAAQQEILAIDIERTPDCARIAREAILAPLFGDPRRDSMELIASELVTNAYLHGSGRIELLLSSTEHSLKISVRCDTDLADLNLASSIESMTSERGRGIALVRELSTEIGSEIIDSRLTVWAELSGHDLGRNISGPQQ